jgi:hypothetical protein
MSKARVSIIGYALYLATAGLLLALIPNVLLPLVGLPPSTDAWIRLVGSLAFVLGIKGIQNSRFEIAPAFQFDVYTRTLVGTFIVVLVILHIAPPIFLALAALDYAGSIWTQLALRADARQKVRSAAA